MNIKEILETYNAATLKTMTTYVNGEPKKLKWQNHEYLSEAFPRPNRVLKELKNLSKAERIALARIVQKNGRISAKRLQQLLQSEPKLLKTTILSQAIIYYNSQRMSIPVANPNYKGKPSFPDLIAGLTLKGLLFSQTPLADSKSALDFVYGRTLFLPNYTQKLLPQITLPDLSNPAEMIPKHSKKGSATLFVRDMARYGRFLQDKQTLKLTTQHLLYKDSLKTIAAQMSFPTNLKSGKKETDNGRLYFMRRLLPKIGLGDQRHYTYPIEALPDAPFWQQDPAERVKATFTAWRDKGAWYELPQLHHYKQGYHILDDAPTELVKTRKTILKQIKNIGSGWISIYELIEDIKDNEYGFLFKKRSFSRNSWYYNYRETHPYDANNNSYDITFDKIIKNESDGWDKVEADLINHIIAGPLYWMGLVDLGYTQPAPKEDLRGRIHIDGYRLTDMGLWLLGMGKKPTFSSESGNLVVQPNFEILMMAPFADEALLTLDQFADVSKETEHVITYELTRKTVYRGQKQGWQVAKILQWLAQKSSQPIPQNIERTLEEWDALHNRIVIHHNVALIETADSDTSQQIKETLPNGRFPIPTVYLSTEKGNTLATQLRKEGWLPIITPADDRSAPNSVQIDQNGRIAFLHPTPSIYAKGLIMPLSTETGDGRILTETQLKAAISDGQTYEQISNSLTHIHVGPLPPKLINKLKAWSKYYGDARQENLILIEFETPRTYRQLLEDPELEKYLTPFKANGRFLATIHPLHIETVHALLAERGVEIHNGLEKQKGKD